MRTIFGYQSLIKCSVLQYRYLFHVSYKMDLHYLRLTFLLLLLEENSCSKKKYYRCTYHKELFFELFDKRDSEEMVCWDSQLHDTTRILFTQKYNNYRREVARGTCPSCNIRQKYQYMCEMKWHWILEKKAQELLQKRNFTQQIASLPVNELFATDTSQLGYRFLQSKYLEYAITSFLLDELDGQSSYVTRFFDHLNAKNILHDWAEYFRRQFVTFFGCSIAVIKVIHAEPSEYTALDEQIKDGDNVLQIACVFASPIQFTYPSITKQSHRPTRESCRSVNWSTSVDVKNDLCTFDDQTAAMAIFTPCQIYYSHFVDVNMSCCPGDLPGYWNNYKLLEELNYTHILIHLSDGAKEFMLKSSITKSISDSLDLDTDSSESDDSSYMEYEWQSDKKERAVELLVVNRNLLQDEESGDILSINLMNVKSTTHPPPVPPTDPPTVPPTVPPPVPPTVPPPVFQLDPLPNQPEKRTVFLKPVAVEGPFDAKYCVVITLFYFIVFFTFCVLLSLIAKYYVEREYFRTQSK